MKRPGTFVVPRGAAVCPRDACHGPMIRRDIDPEGVPGVLGAVIRRRAYRCLACGTKITSREISDGETAKSYSP